MNKAIKINSSQYSYFYGDQIHFPYSIATLISYALKDEEIRSSFSFEKIFLTRDKIEKDISEASDADILLCSCYSWNWQITTKLARETKLSNPDCLVIFGGPEVPQRHEGFFKENPYVDILVHSEGEITLQEILKKYLADKDYTNILGIETKDFKNNARPRIKDLDIIPSPYSTDLIWDLVDNDPNIKYIATWETNRGCPFSCTFCDWGSATKTKLRNFSTEKLFKEIEWFGQNNIVYVDCADGNFGIFVDRDLSIAKKLAKEKEKTGYPTGINLTWVKSSSEKITPIAKVLNSVDLLRAISLSVQSFDKNTLKTVKRSNIKFDKFENLVRIFDDDGLQSYTELIMGLPGETIETYKNNWETLAKIYPMPTVMTWNCSVFVNAPMNDPEYKKKYGIEVFTSPMFMQHSSISSSEIQEYEKMIKATKSQPLGTINKIYVYNWIMMVYHAFGILEFVSRFFNTKGVPYTEFYETFERYSKTNKGIFGKEYRAAIRHAKRGYSGGGWDHVDEELGEICWPLEEASWLRIVRMPRRDLRANIEDFVRYFISEQDIQIDKKVISSLCAFQVFLINSPEIKSPFYKSFAYNWLEFFKNARGLEKKASFYKRTPVVIEEDVIKWGYETAWFGRRKQRNKAKIKDIQKITMRSYVKLKTKSVLKNKIYRRITNVREKERN